MLYKNRWRTDGATPPHGRFAGGRLDEGCSHECCEDRASAAWVAWMLLLLSAGGLGLEAKAADVRESTSLSFVPENVAFYSTSLRMQEQYQAFVGSKAFAALRQLPVVQMGTGFVSLMWNNPSDERVAQIKTALQQPENKELLAMLLDAVSHEIFVCGGEGYADVVRLLNDVNRARRKAQIQALREGREPNEILAEKMLEKLTAELDGAAIPYTVMGFRVSDAGRANKQLARLEEMLKQVLGSQVPRAGRKAGPGKDRRYRFPDDAARRQPDSLGEGLRGGW